MSHQYASQQPAGFQNHLHNIAMVGISGRSAASMVEHLVKAQKHRITGIAREGSSSTLPAGIHEVRRVDYDNHAALVTALHGQDAVVITLSVSAPADLSRRIVDAAVEAGVKWIMPNEWGIDLANEQATKDAKVRDAIMANREHIAKVGAAAGVHWVSVCCGFWYEFSLGGEAMRFGFDFPQKKVTFVDDGMIKTNMSTWPQVGRAVASLLSLKILPDDESDTSSTLSGFADRAVHVSSFHISQKDMFDSVLRVTGDSEKDWTITYEDAVERFNRGGEVAAGGNWHGWVVQLYTRMFYKDGAGSFNDKLDNDALGLPKEDLDEATRVAVKIGNSPAEHVVSGH